MKLHSSFVPALTLCVGVLAQQAPQSGPLKSGIDKAAMDTSCKPCDDFFRFVNGTWLDKNPIPKRFADYGTFRVLSEANRERTRVLLESVANDANATGDAKRLGDYYASCIDTAAIDAAGRKPVDPYLARIDAIRDQAGLKAYLAETQRELPLGPYVVASSPDLKDANTTIAVLAVNATSLPERDYYFNADEKTKKIREEFLKHVERMFGLIGDPQERSAAAAKTVLALETAIAQKQLTNIERRNPYNLYHKMDVAGVAQLAPEIDWTLIFRNLEIPGSTAINVTEPEAAKTVNAMLASTPLDEWKTWLKWRLLNATAPALSKPFRDESFYFRSTVLTGVTEQLPRWQTCANAADSSLGDALGQLFVARHFPPQAKKRMQELVENLRAALAEELENSTWLSPETRKNALAKLKAFTPKIGYTDKWKDYSAIKISRTNYFENVRAVSNWARTFNLQKIGKPVDRTEWGMTPPTVNAYYSPVRNEIAFPAGILQPPFFDMEADDAANYGAIGAVIGHEMGHGFDDQGSRFDAQGNLKNWWTDADRKEFEKRAACVIEQFDSIEVGDGLRHKGKLVVGEGLGDLGGVTIAYKAYKRSLNGKEAPVIDGFTGDQRFFIAFARVWARAHTPEDLRLRLNTDPHPIAKWRAIGTLQNVPEFHKAFSCKQGDFMVRPPEKLCRLW
jgi:predicted metalloendopeptidase